MVYRGRIVAGALFALLLPGCVLVTGTLNPFSTAPQPLEEHVVFGEGRAKVLLLDISKQIGSQDEEGAFGIVRRESTVSRVREQLKLAAEDDDVRAVVLRINSPGGTVTASDVVFHQLMEFKRERSIPVVAQLLDFATSGAYYVALAADEIVASPTTVTGSVGVVLYGVNLSGLMAKIGVVNQTIKSGELKDIGSPLREMTPDERAVLQGVLDGMQRRFLTLVKERRALAANAEPIVADGRILTAEQALQAGLIDRIGYLPDAVRLARERAGESEARVVMYRRPDEFAENIYSRAAVPNPQVNLVNFDIGGLTQATPQFLYLWLPDVE